MALSPSSAPSSTMPMLCSSFTVVESPILSPINEAMNVRLAHHPSSQLTSMVGFPGSVEHYPHPIEMGGATMVAMDEQIDEAMSFLLQDMTRRSASPSMAHVVQPKVGSVPPSWKGDGYVSPDAQVWSAGPGLAYNAVTTSVDLGFDEHVRGTHVDQGQVDLITTPNCGLGIQGLAHQYQHHQRQDYHSSFEEAHYQAREMNPSNFGQGLSGLQFEQCAPGEVVIGMPTHPILLNNTRASSTTLAPVFPSQNLSYFHGASVFPNEQVVVDTTSQATFEYEQMLSNTISNYNQFNHMASTPTNVNVKQEPAFNGELASTPVVQFGHANLPAVLTPDLHHPHYPHIPMAKAHTPIETTATPGDGAPLYIHHPTAPSYFPPMSSNEPLATPPHCSDVMMVPTQHMVPLNLMNFGRIEAPAHFLSAPVDPLVDMTMVPMPPASWPNMGYPQESPHAIQQSLELVHRLQIIHQLQMQQQDQSASQGALYHCYQRVNHVSGESGPSTPQSTTSPFSLPDTPSTVPFATPQQLQHFPEGTVNMSAIHPSTGDLVVMSSLSSLEKAQAPVDHVHSENSDMEKDDDDNDDDDDDDDNDDDDDDDDGDDEDGDDEDGDDEDEESVPESDDDSSYHVNGNNISSSSYHDQEDDIDSDDELLLQEKRTPSPPSSVDEDYSEKAPTTRRTPTRARRARTAFTPTETVEEAAKQSSPTEVKPSRCRRPTTKRRARVIYTSETVEEEVVEQSSPAETPPSRHRKPTASRRARTPHVPNEPIAEAVELSSTASVKRRKLRARRATATATTPTHTETREKVDDYDDDTTLAELPPPLVLEDGTIKCAFLGCPRTFTSMGLLRSHLVVHVEGKPYVCEMCHGDKRYKRNHDLLRHQREIHVKVEEENDEPEDEEMDEDAEDEGDEDVTSSSPIRRRGKREEASPRTSLGRRHRKHRRTRVEHRTIWNGSEMEEIEIELVRPRGRPRVRPLKNTPAVDAFALISSSASLSSPSSSLAVVTRLSQTALSTQNADTAKRLHEWLRIEAQATVAWSVQQTSDPSTGEYHTGLRPPVFAPIDEHEPTNQLIERDEDDDVLVRTGQWRALNERAANALNEAAGYTLHSIKEWLSAPEGNALPRSPTYVVQSMFNALEAPASPTCHVAANIVAAATEHGAAI